MKTVQKIRQVAAAFIVASALIWNARADTLAVNVDTGYFGGLSRGPGVFGWQFSPRQNLVVTSLGLYDTPGFNGFWGDGLMESHLIGIWNVATPTTPVVTALLPSGTETQLHDGARFISVESFQLTAGNEYVIGALSGDVDPDFGDFAANYFPVVIDPALEFIGRRAGGLRSESLVYPEFLEAGVAGEFGPNFMFVVPEPTTAAILLLGAFGIAARWRRRGM